MSTQVTFIVNDGDETYTLDDVPVPPTGTRVEFDGHRYDVVGLPLITYWNSSPPPQNAHAIVHLARVLDELT